MEIALTFMVPGTIKPLIVDNFQRQKIESNRKTRDQECN